MKSQATLLAAVVPVLFVLVPARTGKAAPREAVLEVLQHIERVDQVETLASQDLP